MLYQACTTDKENTTSLLKCERKICVLGQNKARLCSDWSLDSASLTAGTSKGDPVPPEWLCANSY